MRARLGRLLALAGLALAGCPTPAEPHATGAAPAPSVIGERSCVERRAALDVGSATTKLKVADVDRCKQTVIAVLLAAEEAVFYRDDITGNDPSFGDGTMARGVEVLRGFQARAGSLAPAMWAGVATAAFRKAKNGPELVARIEKELGIRVAVISQEQEARLGFLGAVQAAGVDPAQAVVWDIGGGSMQITSLQPDGHLLIYRGELASGQMRDHLMFDLQGRDKDARTPNPVSAADADAARAFAEGYASRDVPDDVKKRLAAAAVVGIGALKYYPDATDLRRSTRAGLEQSIRGLVGKTDADIGGDYAATQVSDRLLIVGFMRALGIEVLKLADVDLTDGLLVESEYWE
jgi:exopolyphosphatase / guanosine-5'-triphosphate,3'-diphosphate pyrophosphatase